MEKIFAFVTMFVLAFSFVAADHDAYHTDANATVDADVGVNASGEENTDTNVSAEGEVVGSEPFIGTQVNSSGNGELFVVTDFPGNGSIIINGVQMDSDLEVQSNMNVMLSDGENASILISPTTAFDITADELGTEPCFGNCEVELVETEHEGEARAAYKITTEKKYKFLGLFTTNAEVSAEIDAETGAVIDTDRPFWTIFSMEVNEDVNANLSGDVGLEENAGFGY